MQLQVNGSVVDEPLTEDLIEQAIFAMSGDSDSFVILSRNEMTYIQVAGDSRSGFLLEYQEGSPERHYSCAELDLSTSDVIEAFQRYLKSDSRWKTDLVWVRGDSDVGMSPAGVRTAVIVVTIVIVAVLAWLALA